MGTFLTIIACASLAATLLVFIARPLLRVRHQLRLPEPRAGSRHLQESKERLLDTLKELDFDHRVGKINDADYAQLRARLEERAMRVMAELDGMAESAELGALREGVEAEIRQHRSAVRMHSEDSVCAGCGAPRGPEDVFCPQCGRRHSDG